MFSRDLMAIEAERSGVSALQGSPARQLIANIINSAVPGLDFLAHRCNFDTKATQRGLYFMKSDLFPRNAGKDTRLFNI